MEAKSKAKELVNKYFNLPCCESVESAKSAANICVNEILKTNPTIKGKSEDLVTMIVQTKAYWYKVQEFIKQF